MFMAAILPPRQPFLQAQRRLRRRNCSGLLPQLPDQRADDVGIVVGPHPLPRIGLLQFPVLRLRNRAEILVLACADRHGAEELVVAVVLGDVAALADAGDHIVRGRDAGDHRASSRWRLEMWISHDALRRELA